MIKRTIFCEVKNSLFKEKVVIIYGARQVGKTTLVKAVQKSFDNSLYLNCDEPDIREALTHKTSKDLHQFIGNYKLVVLDEAQRVQDIGLTLKLLIDTFPEIQIIATGSSSFDLANKIVEPLTGRKFEFHLYPLSVGEIVSQSHDASLQFPLEQRIIYGSYPDIALCQGDRDVLLKELAHSYVYKDILTLNSIRNSESLEKLLQALALQMGSEVSYSELSRTIGIDKETVRDYVRILEQAFIVFRVRPFHKNLRTELRKLRKIYFYDNGVRNALINNLNPVNLINDVGALWENFLVSERMKYLSNHHLNHQMYFWRTQQRQELDYLEVNADIMEAFEFKWNSDKIHVPKAFTDAYGSTPVSLVNKDNYLHFLLPDVKREE